MLACVLPAGNVHAEPGVAAATKNEELAAIGTCAAAADPPAGNANMPAPGQD